jgi:hypothetical protein
MEKSFWEDIRKIRVTLSSTYNLGDKPRATLKVYLLVQSHGGMV